MKIQNTAALERAGKKWLVLRSENDEIVVNQHYPRYSYGPTAEDAVDNMYSDGFQPAGLKEFLVVPLDGAKAVMARPKRTVVIYSSFSL